MHTLTIEVDDTVYEQVLNYLKKFKDSGITFLDDLNQSSFEEHKIHLEEQRKETKSGKSVFFSIEDAELKINQLITKYEHRT